MSNERYARQLALPQWDKATQTQLQRSHVLMIGAGGLGSPALLYLAAAGVGTITVADGDRVSASNLNRQILFETADIGRTKVSAAQDRVRELNPDITLTPHPHYADADFLHHMAAQCDLIIDSTDQFPIRQMINSAAHQHAIPWVYAGLHQYTGILSSFFPHISDEDACFNCLFPQPPDTIESCEDAGIIGAFAGIIGSIQASEAIHILTSKASLRNKLLHYDGRTHRSRITQLHPDPACPHMRQS